MEAAKHTPSRLRLDDLCRLSASIFKSEFAIIVEQTKGQAAAQVYGSSYIWLNKIPAPYGIAPLQADEIPIHISTDLKTQQWFQEHALKPLFPGAHSLVTAAIENDGEIIAALVVFDPDSRAIRAPGVLKKIISLTELARHFLANNPDEIR